MNWRKSSFSFSNGGCAEVSAWRKASHSAGTGECAEIAAWRKSSRSNPNGACAEVGTGPVIVGVRDTKQAYLGGARTVLEFSPAAWREFTGRVKRLPAT